MATVASILWRRLDQEGHDACHLTSTPDGWRLWGVAAFLLDGKPSALRYSVECDAGWRTRSASVDGWIAQSDYSAEIVATGDGRWLLNGEEQASAFGCVDVDLGFTPATNMLPLRRFALEVGAATPAPAAYLTVPELRLTRLTQTYRRLGEVRYHYESPAFSYAEVLEVDDVGFVTSYPDLWQVTSLLTSTGHADSP